MRTPLEKQSLEEVIQATYKDASKTAIFNNAAQVWNHTFFWSCMKPNGGGNPGEDLAQAIDRDLGGLAKFKEDFKAKAVGQFGTGWAWLIATGGKLSITSTPNATNPLAEGETALVTCDVVLRPHCSGTLFNDRSKRRFSFGTRSLSGSSVPNCSKLTTCSFV